MLNCVQIEPTTKRHVLRCLSLEIVMMNWRIASIEFPAIDFTHYSVPGSSVYLKTYLSFFDRCVIGNWWGAWRVQRKVSNQKMFFRCNVDKRPYPWKAIDLHEMVLVVNWSPYEVIWQYCAIPKSRVLSPYAQDQRSILGRRGWEETDILRDLIPLIVLINSLTSNNVLLRRTLFGAGIIESFGCLLGRALLV